ncbi:MAG TPA: AMIN domain-containing protein [Polyangia bacterium]
MVRFVFVSLLVVSAAAWAQSEPDSDDKPAAASAPGASDEGNLNVTEKGGADGHYKGVAPGAQALPPHPPRLPLKKGPQRMTWSGFQVKDGVPTVFVEVTSAPEYHVEDAPGAVIVTLKNTVVPLRNNRRPLDVAAFATAVKEVSTQPKGKDVRVTIKTRGGERPSHHERVEDAAGGFRMLVIELPAK